MSILDLVFPKTCFECKKKGAYLCSSCLKKVRKLVYFCPICRRPSKGSLAHKKCKENFNLNQAVIVWGYDGVIRKAIIALKYRFVKDAAGELVESFVRGLKGKKLPKKAILVPVPMHPKRRKWRGFNQAEELGALVARQMDWNYYPKLLIKTKNTKPQIDLKGLRRKTNLLGTLDLAPQVKITSKNYVIFDDVWTTGSTIKEVANLLKRNGARAIWALTLSRSR